MDIVISQPLYPEPRGGDRGGGASGRCRDVQEEKGRKRGGKEGNRWMVVGKERQTEKRWRKRKEKCQEKEVGSGGERQRWESGREKEAAGNRGRTGGKRWEAVERDRGGKRKGEGSGEGEQEED